MRKALVVGALTAITMVGTTTPAFASAQDKHLSTPYGTLTSNTWRTTGDGSISGNTRQWDYQVSAVYDGGSPVEIIRTTWYAQASLRNGASMDLGISSSGVTAGSSSSWDDVRTPDKYWENTNGAKTASYRSNIVEGPAVNYLASSIFSVNTALLKVRGDARTWQISAGA